MYCERSYLEYIVKSFIILSWSPFYEISNLNGGSIKLPSETLHNPFNHSIFRDKVWWQSSPIPTYATLHIVTRLQTGGLKNRASIPSRSKIFLLLLSTQTNSGAHKTSYSVSTDDSSLGSKSARVRS